MKVDSALVKKVRNSKGWSQEQLGEASGLSLRTIQRLENEGNASKESIRALAKVLDLAPDELMLNKQLDEPATPFTAVKKGFLQFADFSGKATRYEYWWFLAFVVLITAVSTLIHTRAYQLVALIILLPLIAASSRRLNDSGHSVWWQLLFLVPFGQVVVFYLLAQASSD